MKKFTILLVALVAINGAMAQWLPLNSGTTNNLNSGYFTNANTGYAVGDSGTILKTTDGGINWTKQNSNTTVSLASVHFPSNDTGYVVGGNTTILKTTDGGISWISQSLGYNGYLFSVIFTDINTGYAAGFTFTSNPVVIWLSKIFKTVNGGSNWATCYEYNALYGMCYAVKFADSNIGYVLSSPTGMLKTSNAGLSWTQEPINEMNPSSVYFPTTDTGYIVGRDNPYWSGDYNFGKTNNGGGDWTFQNTGTFDTLNSVYFTNTENGHAVSESGKVIYTNNCGTDWTIQYSVPAISLNSVYFVDENVGYVVGNSGTILKTTNGGTTGINESGAEANSIKISPNPAKDKITISSTTITRNTKLSIFNVSGEKVMERQLTSNETQLDISALPRGVYFVRVQNEKITEVTKLIKQ